MAIVAGQRTPSGYTEIVRNWDTPAPTPKVYKGATATPTVSQNGGQNTTPQSPKATAPLTQGSQLQTPTARKTVAYDVGSGGYGIRDSFKNGGLDDSKLGWDGEYVSYNGVKIKPTAVVNGTTYASQKDINDFISRSYASDGRRLVQANQYSPYGVNALGWNGATKDVTLGGKPIQYAYGDENGNAWVDEDILKRAWKDFARENGLISPKELRDDYNSIMEMYADERNNILNEKWSYTPEDMENDLAYQAYKKMYERQAQKAHDDMLGRVAARNGGGMSSAAQLAAAAGYNEQMQMLSDRIPELQQLAYNRWLNDRNARLDAISVGEGNAYNRYAVGTDSGNTAYNRFNESQDRERARRYEPINIQSAQNELVRSELENENIGIGNEASRRNIEQQIWEDAYTKATARGYFTDEEAQLLGITRRADGTYPSPWDAEVQRELAVWNMITKPQMDYEYGQLTGRDEAQYQRDLALQKLKSSRESLTGDPEIDKWLTQQIYNNDEE